ncbi:hypothetical protein [Cloacibacillus porcorum]
MILVTGGAGYIGSHTVVELKDSVFVQKRREPFEGGFGIFADSLPDGWGRLLLDRIRLKNHLDPYGIDILQRLAITLNLLFCLYIVHYRL